MQRQAQDSEFKDRLVAVNRIAKVVKGGKNFRFSALVVVGDEKGRVGAGMGKAAEISEAIRKGTEDAKKHLINVSLLGTSIPHETTGYYGTGKVVEERFDGCAYFVEQADEKALAEAARKVEAVGGSVKLLLKRLPEEA